MKILNISSLGYVGGGSEVIIVKVHDYLLGKGYTMKSLASDLGADKKHFNDYTFRSVSSTGLFKPLFFLFNPYSFFALKKVLKEYAPDLIHIHLMHELTPSVLFLLKNYPTVVTLHEPESFMSQLSMWFLQPSDFSHGSFDSKDLNMGGKLRYLYFNYIQKFLYRFALKNVDVFIAPSKYIQNAAKADVSPVLHLPNFTESGKFHTLTMNYNLLFVGRLEKIKGAESLIKAVSLIIKVFPQTTLTIIGEGGYKADLLKFTTELQLTDHVRFIGWVDNEKLDPYYEDANIVVVPSICPDNFPTVCTEAISRGRPVIGTNMGGIPEIIDDGINGYIVEPDSPGQIAEKVIQLFQDERLLKELGRNARKKAEELSIEKHIAGLEKIYAEVTDKYKQHNTSSRSDENSIAARF